MEKEVKPNQKLIDSAKAARTEILNKLKEVTTQNNLYISTQDLANILYPEGPFYSKPFSSQPNKNLNVNGDLLLSRLKKLEKDGLVEVKKIVGKSLWKFKEIE